MRLTEDAIVLVDPSPDTGGPYPIEFNRCDTPVKILEWVRHLCKKQWVTREHIAYFVSQATSHHNININVDA